MTAPKDQRQEPDELDLDAETVRDLELDDAEGDIRGGVVIPQTPNCGASAGCASAGGATQACCIVRKP